MRSIIASAMCALLVLVLGCGDNSPQPKPTIGPNGQIVSTNATKTVISFDGVQGTANTARNFYVVFDGSGSMRDSIKNSQGFSDKLAGAKWAVDKFVTALPNDVNLGLFVFDNSGKREVVALGPNNRDQFLKSVQNVTAGNGTPLVGSIDVAIDKLVEQYKKQFGYGEYRLIVVTDGAQDDGKFDKVIMKLRDCGVPIQLITIGLGVGDKHDLKVNSDSFKAADSIEALREGLKEAAAEIDVSD